MEFVNHRHMFVDQFNLQEKAVNTVESVKYLDVIMDSFLKWKEHISMLVKKL